METMFRGVTFPLGGERSIGNNFVSQFILHGDSTREPASIECNDEQVDLFYSVGLQRNYC